jgi:MoxR-like ATPase
MNDTLSPTSDDAVAINADTAQESMSEFEAAAQLLQTLRAAVCSKVLGRDDVVELTLIALLANGHVLLEDYPGSGKTTLAKAIGETISSGTDAAEFASFRRIQFTPDLLPSDVTGSAVFDSDSGGFAFRRGPLFAHVVLADEINRTSPKVQSAMLEAMGEKQVTVDNSTYPLDELFFVIATQNPLDMVGTYPLPTPQLDRFLFKITMAHIDREAELEVLNTYQSRQQPLLDADRVTRDAVLAARVALQREVHVADAIKTALVDLSRALREDERVLQGNSTRSLVLMLPALQVAAALAGRRYVSADDIERLMLPVLGHRIELAPGVNDIEAVLRDNAVAPLEALARSTLQG